MISGIVDKLFFGVILLSLMQLPLLADHYLQYLQGYADAVEIEVLHYQKLANQYGYPNVEALIDAHKNSSLPSVKADAEHKSQKITELAQLKQGVALLTQGNLAKKVLYILSPNRSDTLLSVTQNFKPGIPLTPRYLLFCTLLALLLNIVGASPARITRHLRSKHRKTHISGVSSHK